MPERPGRRDLATATPPARSRSVRAAITDALAQGELSARDISAQVGIPERDVAEHLEHLAHSLEHGDSRLKVVPARCIGCGYTFESRTRRTRPSRCPRCKSERIDPARFALEPSTRR